MGVGFHPEMLTQEKKLVALENYSHGYIEKFRVAKKTGNASWDAQLWGWV